MPLVLRSLLASLLVSACAADAVVPPDDERDERNDRGAGEGVQQAGRVSGLVSGLASDAQARVILGNDAYLDMTAVVAGQFDFANVPDGMYFAKLEVAGHSTSATQAVTVRDGAGHVELSAAPLEARGFVFAWTEDASRGGHEHTSETAPHSAAAQNLLDHYNITLADDVLPWTQEHAARLLRMMRAVPQQVRSVSQPYWLKPSSWSLSAGGADDLEVTRTGAGDFVRISAAAFSDAAPRMAALDGSRDAYFAKRLHTAVVRYVTREGTTPMAVERILTQRYGVTAVVADYARLTGGEPASSFQPFAPTELVELITMFEEMPEGFHAVPGLTTIVRRRIGGSSPVSASTQAGYLELTDAAFSGSRDELHHALVREKAEFVVTPELESAWSTMGVAMPLSAAIAEYVSTPAVTHERSVAGFALIRDQIMDGGLELDPDATWPGQVVDVAIRTRDEPDVGQRVVVELGLRTDATTFTGASSATLRLFSEGGTSVIIALDPTTESGAVVRGEVVLGAAMQSGFWRPDQIVVRGRSGSPLVHSVLDVGWKLFID